VPQYPSQVPQYFSQKPQYPSQVPQYPSQVPQYPSQVPQYPQASPYSPYPGYSQPTQPPQPPQPESSRPTYKISHNMDSYSGPTISDLKSCPTLHADEFTDFHSAASEPVQAKDWESSLVDLDSLGQESKPKSKEQQPFGVFF
jgi:hypothetical protein